MGGMDGPWASLSLQMPSEHTLIFLCLMLGMPYGQYLTLYSSLLEIGDNIPAYWESYGLMGNYPLNHNMDSCRE